MPLIALHNAGSGLAHWAKTQTRYPHLVAAVSSHRLFLYSSSGLGSTIGSVEVRSLGAPWSASEAALRLEFEYRSQAGSEETQSSLVYLQAHVESVADRRIFGRLILAPAAAPREEILGQRDFTGWWLWHLTANDIEVIEQQRARIGSAAPILFGVALEGVGVVAGSPIGFHGDTQMSIAASEWVDLIRQLGYSMPPPIDELVSQSMTASDVWKHSRERLAKAWRQLALGDDHAALQSAYRLFDDVVRNPYRADWTTILGATDVPAEKLKAISALLNAHTTLLNKLARHPADETNAQGERVMLPLDHWEAELLVGLSQLFVAAVERWLAMKAEQ
jgi:hypothetical protein